MAIQVMSSLASGRGHGIPDQIDYISKAWRLNCNLASGSCATATNQGDNSNSVDNKDNKDKENSLDKSSSVSTPISTAVQSAGAITPVYLMRPLKDFLPKMMALYVHFKAAEHSKNISTNTERSDEPKKYNMVVHNVEVLALAKEKLQSTSTPSSANSSLSSSLAKFNGSITQLSQTFVHKLQHNNEDTIFKIVRTCEHLTSIQSGAIAGTDGGEDDEGNSCGSTNTDIVSKAKSASKFTKTDFVDSVEQINVQEVKTTRRAADHESKKKDNDHDMFSIDSNNGMHICALCERSWVPESPNQSNTLSTAPASASTDAHKTSTSAFSSFHSPTLREVAAYCMSKSVPKQVHALQQNIHLCPTCMLFKN
jgi:hypothetical protein